MAANLSASALIDAPAADVYAIIADYHDGHARIIPRPPFVDLAVERGGRGAGTSIRVQLKLLGRVVAYRAEVTEPEPGRILAEHNDNGYVTRFVVDPRAGGRQAHVTIETDLGKANALTRWLFTRLLRPVYVRELELIAEVAAAAKVS